MTVFVVIPLQQDDEGASKVSERLTRQRADLVKLYHANFQYTYFVAFDGTAHELETLLGYSNDKISVAIIPVIQLAGFGPTSLKDWINQYERSE